MAGRFGKPRLLFENVSEVPDPWTADSEPQISLGQDVNQVRFYGKIEGDLFYINFNYYRKVPMGWIREGEGANLSLPNSYAPGLLAYTAIGANPGDEFYVEITQVNFVSDPPEPGSMTVWWEPFRY